MKKSELLLNPYKEHLKKPYLHGAGTLEIDGVQYSADEYITMLEEENVRLVKNLAEYKNEITDLKEENRKLKNSIEYRKKKAESNQEKANQIDNIMSLPGVMVDGKIDWSKVSVYYMM